jgi:cyclopropane-fatty-acyl-phospholipid synthase
MLGSAKQKVEELAAKADIRINGTRPWDISVHDERFYSRVLSGSSLALGESYMDGWWDADDIPGLLYKLLSSDFRSSSFISPALIFNIAKARLLNLQSTARAVEVAEAHYDLGNDLFTAMLDNRMTYTCGYWKNAKTLDEAQEAKLDLICQKVGLHEGQSVLDIGCGFGSFAKYAAEKYGAHVTGISVSKEQISKAKEITKGLPVEICFQDYRETVGVFDHIVSIGMFEAVGYKNFKVFMQKVRSLLKDDGIFLLHTLGSNKTVSVGEPWLNKYIFPNGMLPSIKQIGSATEGLFVMEDWQNFGSDYEKTVRAWFENFDHAWPTLKNKYNERFYRMWKYYLLSMAGVTKARYIQLWQVVFSKKGVLGGYRSVR